MSKNSMPLAKGHHIVRKGFSSLLDVEAKLEGHGRIRRREKGRWKGSTAALYIVLTNVSMPGLRRLMPAARIKKNFLRVMIPVLTGHTGEGLASTIPTVCWGDSFLDGPISRWAIQGTSDKPS